MRASNNHRRPGRPNKLGAKIYEKTIGSEYELLAIAESVFDSVCPCGDAIEADSCSFFYCHIKINSNDDYEVGVARDTDGRRRFKQYLMD